jgi:hypothetical protein
MNVFFISTAASVGHNWSNASHIMNRPNKMPTTRSLAMPSEICFLNS